jgi:Sulfotransferase family
LKSSDHVFGLGALLAVFPDAIIIQTHRDPFDVLKSQIQLTQLLEGMFYRPAKLEQLNLREAGKVAHMLDYISRFRDAHPELSEHFIDVKYSELITDPFSSHASHLRTSRYSTGEPNSRADAADSFEPVTVSKASCEPCIGGSEFQERMRHELLTVIVIGLGFTTRRTKSISRKAGFVKATPAKLAKSQRPERAFKQTQQTDEHGAGPRAT